MPATRSSDPATSHEAARSLIGQAIRDSQACVLQCFAAFGPMTDATLITLYNRHREERDWIAQSDSGLRTRRKELTPEYLVVHDVVRTEGVRKATRHRALVNAVRPR